MTTDNSLFDDNSNTTPQIDPNKNYLEELVGDNKKFKSPEDLARGKAEADLYVDHLKRQLDEMREDTSRLREEYNAREKLQDLIDRLENNGGQSASSDDNLNANETNMKQRQEPDYDTLISAKLKEARQKEKEEENFSSVVNKLQERYGASYKQRFSEQAQELGLDRESAERMARTSPKAFFKTFGLDEEQRRDTFDAPVRNTQRGDSQLNKSVPKRTWSYYQNMRKTNPDLYHNPKTIAQMHKDRVELGDAFKDGDYVSYV